MKKNISINISGILFNIEEDGYERLKLYLDEIKRYFATYDDTGEIAADIENRVAEIFLSKLNPNKQVITSEDVESLITQMGNVKDFEAIEEPLVEEAIYEKTYTTENEESSSQTTGTGGAKRLFRDGKRKILGGVASGIANYLNVDPFWIRLLFVIILFDFFLTFSFSSALFIGYIILWVVIPEKYDMGEDRKMKKMYRDPDNKVIGGVSSGLAAYFGVDPTIIRLLFIILIFLGGSGIIAYVVLWAITPEAKTLTDRMQMQGEPLTLHNIEHNIKKNLNVKENSSESTLVKVVLFPFRLIAAIFSGAGRAASPLLKFLADVIRILAGVILISFGFSIMLAILLTTGVLAGMYSETYLELLDVEIFAELMHNTIPTFAIVALFFAVFVPGLVILLLGVATIANRWVLNRTASWVTFGLWILSLITLAFAVPNVALEFKERDSVTSEETFNVDTQRTILFELKNYDHASMEDVNLTITGTPDSLIRLEKKIYARGRTEAAAREHAEKTDYIINQEDSIIFLSKHLSYPENESYHAQELKGTLYIPYGRKFVLDYDMREILSYSALYKYGYRRSDLRGNNTWMFEKNGSLVCLTCDFSANSDGKETRTQLSDSTSERKIVFESFNELNIRDGYAVKIVQNDEYSIVIRGDKVNASKIETELFNNKLNIRNLHYNDNETDGIEVIISTPNLKTLNINNRASVTIENFKSDRLNIHLSDAKANISNLNTKVLDLDLRNSSELKIKGKANEVRADVYHDSELRGKNLEAGYINLDIYHNSIADIYATGNLKVMAHDNSLVTYSGSPEMINKEAYEQARIMEEK